VGGTLQQPANLPLLVHAEYTMVHENAGKISEDRNYLSIYPCIIHQTLSYNGFMTRPNAT